MLTIRIADEVSLRRAVLEVAHAATGANEPLSWFQARRLCSPARARATWWLLEQDGEPVSSLVCYPLSLRHDGVPLAGYGLGAVATRPDRQRQGHAARLCQHVMQANTGVGLLFSTIPAAYYAKMGFRALPVSEHACLDLDAFVSTGPVAPLRALDPRLELPLLMAAHDSQRQGLRMHRGARRWAHSLEQNPEDRFFAVDGGYLRVTLDDEGLDLVELVSADPASAWRAAAALARSLRAQALTTWLSPPEELVALLEARSRHRTQLMVTGSEIASATISGADYF